MINPSTMDVTQAITPSQHGTVGNLVTTPEGNIIFLNETETLFNISASWHVAGSYNLKPLMIASLLSLEYFQRHLLMVNSQSNVVVSYDISTEKTLTIKEDNGTHMIYVKNLTAYCTTDYGISVDVNRKSASANAYFTHYSYISGNVTPGAATWYVNGKKVSLSTGSFNDSVTHGTYHLKVTSPGYKTYYDDVTMGTNTTMNLNIHLKKISSSTGPNMNEIYCIIGGIGGLGVILAIILIFRRR